MFKDDSLISKDNKVSNSKKVILKTILSIRKVKT